MRRFIILGLILMLSSGSLFSAGAQEATSPAPLTEGDLAELLEQLQSGEVCAWPAEVTIDTLNVAYPDLEASYFVMPYMLDAGQSLIVEGAYPFARFSSLTTYFGATAGGQGLEVLAWLRDSEIMPDAGSVNPAIDPNAPDDPERRQWTVRVSGTAPAGDATPTAVTDAGENVIPAHLEGGYGTRGWLILRVYVPADPADSTGGVGLPALFLEDETEERRELAACTPEEEQKWTAVIWQSAQAVVAEAPRLPLPPDPDAAPGWVSSKVPGLAPNPDNRYLLAPVVWESGRIVVIRGQAPTFPDTRAGESPTTPTQLRYWSFCTGSNTITPPDAYPTTACLSDFEIPVDDDDFYAIVVSQPEDRPANATVENGVAWIQGADPSLPDLVIMRHLLPSAEFIDRSVWAVPELTPGVAAEIMGSYYPQITYCDTATFEEGGAEACFAMNATPVAES
jgi:hypothetical protein